MKNEEFEIEPNTLGERWYLWAVRDTKSLFSTFLFILIGIISIVLLALGLQNNNDYCFNLPLFFLATSLVYFERHMGYNIIRRQEEMISKLNKKINKLNKTKKSV
jgi:hypothetical protein